MFHPTRPLCSPFSLPMDTVTPDVVAVHIGRMIFSAGLISRVEWQGVADLPTVDGCGVLLVSGAFGCVEVIERSNRNCSAGVVNVIHNVSWNPTKSNWRRVNHQHACSCAGGQKPRAIRWRR